MLAERAKEWTEQWLREGREQGLALGLERGIERGRAEERALLCRSAARKFDAETADRLAGLLDRLSDPERLAEIGDWLIECGMDADLLDRAGRESPMRHASSTTPKNPKSSPETESSQVRADRCSSRNSGEIRTA